MLCSLEPKSKVDPESYRLELPFDVKSLHPLNREKYLVEALNINNNDNKSPLQLPKGGNLFLLRKESSDDVIPTLLSPISQTSATTSEDSAANVEFLDKEATNVLEIR